MKKQYMWIVSKEAVERLLDLSIQNKNGIIIIYIVEQYEGIWDKIQSQTREDLVRYSISNPYVFLSIKNNAFSNESYRSMQNYLETNMNIQGGLEIFFHRMVVGNPERDEFKNSKNNNNNNNMYDNNELKRNNDDDNDHSSKYKKKFSIDNDQHISWLINYGNLVNMEKQSDHHKTKMDVIKQKIRARFGIGGFDFCLKYGNINQLVYIVGECGVLLTQEMMYSVIRCNNVQILQQFIQLKPQWKNSVDLVEFGLNSNKKNLIQSCFDKSFVESIQENMIQKSNETKAKKKFDFNHKFNINFENEEMKSMANIDMKTNENVSNYNNEWYDNYSDYLPIQTIETLRRWKKQWGTNDKIVTVMNSNIESSLMNAYQRCKYSDKLHKFMFDNIILNEKYFANQNYQYLCQSNIYGTIQSNKNGIYLFHKVLTDSNLSDAFIQLMPKIDKSKLLIFNNQNRIAFECLAFGSYNELYRNKKFDKKNKNMHDLFEWLHYCHKNTTQILFDKLKEW